jgi:hypothetical protein
MGTDMATPTPPPTRQQLDDLDALLQRMLALPVNPSEGPSEPPAEPPFPEPFGPPAGNVIIDDSGPTRPTAPFPRSPVPAATVSLPLLNPVPLAQRRPPVLPRPDRPVSPRQALIASRPPPEPLLLRPLLALNRLFDTLALGLGSPGRWLRRPTGRTLLGLIGLALLAAAVAFALLDRVDWPW